MATAEKNHEGDKFKFPDETEGEITAEVSLEGGDGLEVEVVDDTPPKDRGRKPLDKKVEDPSDDELEEYSAGVKKRIKELTHARHDERRRAEALERQFGELQTVAQRLLADKQAMEQRFNAGAQEFGKVALEGAEAAMAKAKADLKAALEAFDNDAVVAAQEALASAALRVQQAKAYRAPQVSTGQAQQEAVQQRQPQPRLDQKTLDWQARNQWFGQSGNEDATSYALGLHQKLVNSGVDPRSDEYFEQIDARMKSKFPELFDEDGDEEDIDDKPTKPKKKPTSVVAPAARTPASPGKVRLTQTQVALAKRLGLTPQQYAAQVVKLQKEA